MYYCANNLKTLACAFLQKQVLGLEQCFVQLA
jgi:hypothetical protein